MAKITSDYSYSLRKSVILKNKKEFTHHPAGIVFGIAKIAKKAIAKPKELKESKKQNKLKKLRETLCHLL